LASAPNLTTRPTPFQKFMIDLHTHTDRSDGSVSPPQLVLDAKAMGLEALGITDHDTLDGYDIAAPLAAQAGLELVCGIELSTRPDPPPDGSRPPSVHLLGYFLQEPAAPQFRQWIKGHQDSRRERNRKLIAKLNSLGVEITLEEVQVLGKHLTGRPHFAKILLKKGYVKTNQEAFDRYLADNASASVEREEPELVEGVRKIREGGGMPSLAHPVRLPERDRASLEKLLRVLTDNGLQGLEVYHSEHSPEDTALYKELAAQFNLIETGGTDFHGDNKPSIHLGTGKGNNVHATYDLLENMRRGVAEFAAR
jgi:predicted metal-dependent phosphoesterase TrpH